MYNGIQTIELKKTPKKSGFLYEAIIDGVTVSTRTSNRDYVAALVYKGETKISNGVGRMDLLPGALKDRKPDYIALLK